VKVGFRTQERLVSTSFSGIFTISSPSECDELGQIVFECFLIVFRL